MRRNFNYVHALEIQGAGYLVDSVVAKMYMRPPIILTNWGSDIIFFQHLPEHRDKIISALNSADYYSAECQRDYDLAKEMGFSGIDLPCIPNAGGFPLEDFTQQTKASSRTLVIAKTYGGEFGRGDLVIECLRRILNLTTSYNVFMYSVTDDLIHSVERLTQEFPGRITYSLRRNPLHRAEMAALFRKSRVYVGISRSDGISTSFLEALNFGCYPIQSNTSCADDWANKGVIASIVPQNLEVIVAKAMTALGDNLLVDHAQLVNQKVVREYLDSDTIKKIALTFYD